MPARLPIFPLNVVLFPGAPLPLHIFEPRYRRMLADCLAGDQRFGITTLGGDGEITTEGVVGCVALIRACHELPDGRSNIVVTGGRRFVLVQYLDEPLPYQVALVDEFDDEPTPSVSPEALTELRRRAEQYATAMAALNDASTAEIEWPEDASGLSFHVSALLDLSVATRLRLLGLRSGADRIQLLLELLPGLTREADTRARVHVGARSNGKGGDHPVIDSEP